MGREARWRGSLEWEGSRSIEKKSDGGVLLHSSGAISIACKSEKI